jgi:CHAT domain-containing protein
MVVGALACLLVTVASSLPAFPAEAGVEQKVSSPTETDQLMVRGKSAFSSGNPAASAESYRAASDRYAASGDRASQAEALIMAGQATSFTGQYRKALEPLEQALSIAAELGDNRRKAMALGAIGNALIGIGDSEKARKNLDEGLAVAKSAGLQKIEASIRNNQGNLAVSLQDHAAALTAYRESSELAEKCGDFGLAASAYINAATIVIRTAKPLDAASLLAKATGDLQKVEDSAAKAYALINAGLARDEIRRQMPDQRDSLLKDSHAALSDALSVAEKIDDPRSMSYAYGYLAHLYEEDGQLPAASELTRRAIFNAQLKGTTEALYRWQWQNGRILGRMGKTDEAIASYRLAIRTLQSVRDEMSSCYASPDSGYQKSASAVSAELVDLLLHRASKVGAGESPDPFLAEARDTLELLKVYELREYFRDDCIDASRSVEKRLDSVSDTTAVFYPILLKDRVELLVSIGGRLKRSTIPVGIEAFTQEIRNLRHKIVKRSTWEFLPHAQKLYDWLIRPLEGDLAASKTDTLVFVPDGALRSIPMAALHDGERFLVSRYRTAVTPGLNLTDPKPVNREQARLLTVGVSQAVQGFPGLPYVADELKAIREIYGGQVLQDRDFRLTALEGELKREPYSMIHIASHGQFGGKLNDTFLLAYDEKFTMDRLSDYVGLFRFRNEPLDLLTLSACETAAGDDRAALGLAGVAVRAGARSALATLWHVNDPASYELVVEFYRQLHNQSMTRAAALQAAQLKLLTDERYDHPGYWAPFLLINNWL